MKKSTKTFKNDSIFVQLMVSTTMSYTLFGVGAFFVYFLSPEGDPLNKGENGNGSWNLWVGILIWVIMVVLYFFKDKLSQVDFDNDPELKRLKKEEMDLVDSQIPILLRLKKRDPELWKLMVDKGLVPDDLKGDDEDSSDEGKKDSQKPEGRE